MRSIFVPVTLFFLLCGCVDETDGVVDQRMLATTTITVDGSAFRAITPYTVVDYTNGCSFSGGGPTAGVIAPVSLPIGATVTAARFYVIDNLTGPTFLQGGFEAHDIKGSLSGNVTAGSSGTGEPQTLATADGHPVTILVDRGYFLTVYYPSASSGFALSNVRFAELDYQ